MFLSATLERNPSLVEAAIDLHQRGAILPNTYVLDVDAIKHNTHQLVKAAEQARIALYMMTKQIGRNPDLARIIAENGIEKAVAVDPWEAVTLGEAGIQLGNVGHLVQIPTHMLERILHFRPEVVTVFSLEKAAEVSQAAERQGFVQNILLKVIGENDVIYEGQQGGFTESDVLAVAQKIRKLPGVRIAGVTAFPCFLYNGESGEVEPTANAHTVRRCVERLRTELGLSLEQINMPSATSVASIPKLAEWGATHGEPGHAFTGTTPLHEQGEQAEIPAMVYVSEISHTYEDRAYAFGGGFYRRSNVRRAIVGNNFNEMRNRFVPVLEPPPEYIDYYGTLKAENQNISIGDTVIYAFRTQIFVTRSEVALVEGIQNGRPTVAAIYDSLGKKLRLNSSY